MPNPLIVDRGTPAALVSSGAAIASGFFSLSGTNPIRMANTSNYLAADVRLFAAFSVAPSAGSIQLFKVPRSVVSDTQGPTTTGSGTFPTGFTPVLVGTFNNNYSTTGQWLSLGGPIALDADAEYFLYNNGTSQSIASGWVFEWQPFSPGT